MAYARVGIVALVFHFSFFILNSHANAQDAARLRLYEDTLKHLSDSIVLSATPQVRQASSFAFIKTLVRALKTEGSFDYPFDSLKRVSVVKAPDKKFRVFTWALLQANDTYRFYGTVQLNDKKKLLMFPLFDYTDKIKNTDTLTNTDKWYGAVYYKIVQKKKHYFLFGWKGVNAQSTKKVIDVITLSGKSKPRFGAPVFVWDDKNGHKTHSRFVTEYKRDATVSVNYDDDTNMILYDHTTPTDEKSNGLYFNYIPDGTYEGFAYKHGKWVHIENVWTSTQQTPFPKPIDFKKKKLTKPRGKK